MARRFWCDAVLCDRRIFCEQFDDGVLARYSRRTQRLETIVHHLGLASGGRPAAAFANRLMMPVSNDTLLRVVHRRVAEQNDELSVIGVDDFAFRRGQTFEHSAMMKDDILHMLADAGARAGGDSLQIRFNFRVGDDPIDLLLQQFRSQMETMAQILSPAAPSVEYRNLWVLAKAGFEDVWFRRFCI